MFKLLEDRSGKDFQRMNTLAYFVTTEKRFRASRPGSRRVSSARR